ncbi:MAG: sulfur oxidation c-type cytochrome SoxX, partial [Gammaproteobacteria bacterium]
MRPDWKKAIGGAVLLAVCAVASGEVSDAEVEATIKSSFRERGIATMDRLEQTDMQRECSKYSGKELPEDVRHAIEKKALESVKYPADGEYLGDWKAGETIAQSGRGFQFSDKADTVTGGNCYACHELSKAEISFGNIGPSLHHYGKKRGDSEETRKYTWARIWNPHSYSACTHMPRFGAAGLLTEK